MILRDTRFPKQSLHLKILWQMNYTLKSRYQSSVFGTFLSTIIPIMFITNNHYVPSIVQLCTFNEEHKNLIMENKDCNFH